MSQALRARRAAQPIAVAMLDVDWFKTYNDLYGHVAGDNALKAVAHSIQSVIRRPGDWAARYGGEEFFIILPGVGLTGARHVLDTVLRAVEALAVSHEGSPLGRLTISVGIAAVDRLVREDGIEALQERLVHEADKALYQAKRSGRHRIMAARLE